MTKKTSVPLEPILQKLWETAKTPWNLRKRKKNLRQTITAWFPIEAISINTGWETRYQDRAASSWLC